MKHSTETYLQQFYVDKKQRALHKKHQPCCIWLTGLSASGKSTIANMLEKELYKMGIHTYLLDGDNIRHGLCGDLSFSNTDRSENIRRIAEVSKLMVDAGLVVIAAFISPFEEERQKARELFSANEFIEVFVDTPLAVCEKRDPKGLYIKARQGKIKDFTGISSEYQKPNKPEIILNTQILKAKECAYYIIKHLGFK